MKTPTLSVVLPCYNEAGNLPSMLAAYARVLERIGGTGAELILVDNGSTDATADVLGRELQKPEYRFARVVEVKKNIGYGHGICTGLAAARGEYLAYSHADHQCDPADVIRAYTTLRQSPAPERTLLKGDRVGRAPFFSTMFRWMASLLFLRPFNDINGQPKVFHRGFFGKWKNAPDDFALDLYVQRMAFKEGLEMRTIPVRFGQRRHGQSKWATGVLPKAVTILKYFLYLLKLRVTEW